MLPPSPMVFFISMQRRTCALITIASDDGGDEEDLENFILMQRFSLNLLKCHSRLWTESTFPPLSNHFLLFTIKEIGQFYFLHFSKDERRETCGCKSVCQLSQLVAKGKNLNAAHALILCQVCNGGRKTSNPI